MKAEEAKRGFEVIHVGSVSWLPVSDWHHDNVVSRDGNNIRLVAICAVNKGEGAFNRLITGIIQAGYTPVIVGPVVEMRAIMKRWRWKCKHIGSSFEDHEEHWFPKPIWMVQRLRRYGKA